MIKGSIPGSCWVPPAPPGSQWSCRWPVASRSRPGALGASRQDIAEVCAGLAGGMAGAAMPGLGTWRKVSPRLLSSPQVLWVCVPAPLHIGTTPRRLGRIWLSWRGTEYLAAPEQGASCVVGTRTEPPELCCGLGSPTPGGASRRAPSRGDGSSAATGRAEPPAPRWGLGVRAPSSAVPARGESQVLHALLLEGFSCSTGLQI